MHPSTSSHPPPPASGFTPRIYLAPYVYTPTHAIAYDQTKRGLTSTTGVAISSSSASFNHLPVRCTYRLPTSTLNSTSTATPFIDDDNEAPNSDDERILRDLISPSSGAARTRRSASGGRRSTNASSSVPTSYPIGTESTLVSILAHKLIQAKQREADELAAAEARERQKEIKAKVKATKRSRYTSDTEGDENGDEDMMEEEEEGSEQENIRGTDNWQYTSRRDRASRSTERSSKRRSTHQSTSTSTPPLRTTKDRSTSPPPPKHHVRISTSPSHHHHRAHSPPTSSFDATSSSTAAKSPSSSTIPPSFFFPSPDYVPMWKKPLEMPMESMEPIPPIPASNAAASALNPSISPTAVPPLFGPPLSASVGSSSSAIPPLAQPTSFPFAASFSPASYSGQPSSQSLAARARHELQLLDTLHSSQTSLHSLAHSHALNLIQSENEKLARVIEQKEAERRKEEEAEKRARAEFIQRTHAIDHQREVEKQRALQEADQLKTRLHQQELQAVHTTSILQSELEKEKMKANEQGVRVQHELELARLKYELQQSTSAQVSSLSSSLNSQLKEREEQHQTALTLALEQVKVNQKYVELLERSSRGRQEEQDHSVHSSPTRTTTASTHASPIASPSSLNDTISQTITALLRETSTRESQTLDKLMKQQTETIQAVLNATTHNATAAAQAAQASAAAASAMAANAGRPLKVELIGLNIADQLSKSISSPARTHRTATQSSSRASAAPAAAAAASSPVIPALPTQHIRTGSLGQHSQRSVASSAHYSDDDFDASAGTTTTSMSMSARNTARLSARRLAQQQQGYENVDEDIAVDDDDYAGDEFINSQPATRRSTLREPLRSAMTQQQVKVTSTPRGTVSLPPQQHTQEEDVSVEFDEDDLPASNVKKTSAQNQHHPLPQHTADDSAIDEDIEISHSNSDPSISEVPEVKQQPKQQPTTTKPHASAASAAKKPVHDESGDIDVEFDEDDHNKPAVATNKPKSPATQPQQQQQHKVSTPTSSVTRTPHYIPHEDDSIEIEEEVPVAGAGDVEDISEDLIAPQTAGGTRSHSRSMVHQHGSVSSGGEVETDEEARSVAGGSYGDSFIEPTGESDGAIEEDVQQQPVEQRSHSSIRSAGLKASAAASVEQSIEYQEDEDQVDPYASASFASGGKTPSRNKLTNTSKSSTHHPDDSIEEQSGVQDGSASVVEDIPDASASYGADSFTAASPAGSVRSVSRHARPTAATKEDQTVPASAVKLQQHDASIDEEKMNLSMSEQYGDASFAGASTHDVPTSSAAAGDSSFADIKSPKSVRSTKSTPRGLAATAESSQAQYTDSFHDLEETTTPPPASSVAAAEAASAPVDEEIEVETTSPPPDYDDSFVSDHGQSVENISSGGIESKQQQQQQQHSHPQTIEKTATPPAVDEIEEDYTRSVNEELEGSSSPPRADDDYSSDHGGDYGAEPLSGENEGSTGIPEVTSPIGRMITPQRRHTPSQLELDAARVHQEVIREEEPSPDVEEEKTMTPEPAVATTGTTVVAAPVSAVSTTDASSSSSSSTASPSIPAMSKEDLVSSITFSILQDLSKEFEEERNRIPDLKVVRQRRRSKSGGDGTSSSSSSTPTNVTSPPTVHGHLPLPGASATDHPHTAAADLFTDSMYELDRITALKQARREAGTGSSISPTISTSPSPSSSSSISPATSTPVSPTHNNNTSNANLASYATIDSPLGLLSQSPPPIPKPPVFDTEDSISDAQAQAALSSAIALNRQLEMEMSSSGNNVTSPSSTRRRQEESMKPIPVKTPEIQQSRQYITRLLSDVMQIENERASAAVVAAPSKSAAQDPIAAYRAKFLPVLTESSLNQVETALMKQEAATKAADSSSSSTASSPQIDAAQLQAQSIFNRLLLGATNQYIQSYNQSIIERYLSPTPWLIVDELTSALEEEDGDGETVSKDDDLASSIITHPRTRRAPGGLVLSLKNHLGQNKSSSSNYNITAADLTDSSMRQKWQSSIIRKVAKKVSAMNSTTRASELAVADAISKAPPIAVPPTPPASSASGQPNEMSSLQPDLHTLKQRMYLQVQIEQEMLLVDEIVAKQMKSIEPTPAGAAHIDFKRQQQRVGQTNNTPSFVSLADVSHLPTSDNDPSRALSPDSANTSHSSILYSGSESEWEGGFEIREGVQLVADIADALLHQLLAELVQTNMSIEDRKYTRRIANRAANAAQKSNAASSSSSFGAPSAASSSSLQVHARSSSSGGSSGDSPERTSPQSSQSDTERKKARRQAIKL